MADPNPEPDPPARSGPRRRVRLALACLVVGGLGAGVLVAARAPDPDPTGRLVGAAAGLVQAGPATTTTAAAPPALPVPEAMPDDPYEATPQVVVGRIEIPEVGVDQAIQRGITLTAINRGPGWWPGTAMPGQLGNVVIAGHRTTFSRPFHRLHELEPGDQVVLTTDAGRFTYAVRDVIVVPPEWIDIAAQSHAHTATLFACHPIGSAAQRIVAKLRLLAPDGTPVDPDAALPPVDAEAQRTDHTLYVRERSTPDPGRDPLAAAGQAPG